MDNPAVGSFFFLGRCRMQDLFFNFYNIGGEIYIRNLFIVCQVLQRTPFGFSLKSGCISHG